MTNTVAATSSAVATADTHRAQSARAASTSFAEVQAAAVKTTDSGKGTSSSSDATGTSTAEAPKGEKTEAVKGHSYKEIVSGPRNGMFINNPGNRRDGEAFLIVKRHGREFHIYGSGDDRTVYEVGRARDAAGSGTSGTTGTDSSNTAPTTTGSTTPDTSGASTPATTAAGTTA